MATEKAYRIVGGKKLEGIVNIGGCKNAAVATFPAAILVNGKTTLKNVPDISDIKDIIAILRHLNVEVTNTEPGEYVIDTTNIVNREVPYFLTRRFRASYYFMGALLGRFGYAKVGMPGGCALDNGDRPINYHRDAFVALGAEYSYDEDNAMIELSAPNGLKSGCTITFPQCSVGATINVLLAASCIEGETVINNAAEEPHIVDLQNFLCQCGPQIYSSRHQKTVTGIKQENFTSSCVHLTIPDQIEAGTYMLAAAATRSSEVIINNIDLQSVNPFAGQLICCGVFVDDLNDKLKVRTEPDCTLKTCGCIETRPYPGFPTDMQAQFAAFLATIPNSTSVIDENIWNNRFAYVAELKKMMPDLKTSVNDDVGRLTLKTAKGKYRGNTVVGASDLRAGAALVIAALASEGTTIITNISHIQRGYENIVGKLQGLGANIEIVDLELKNYPKTDE